MSELPHVRSVAGTIYVIGDLYRLRTNEVGTICLQASMMQCTCDRRCYRLRAFVCDVGVYESLTVYVQAFSVTFTW